MDGKLERISENLFKKSFNNSRSTDYFLMQGHLQFELRNLVIKYIHNQLYKGMGVHPRRDRQFLDKETKTENRITLFADVEPFETSLKAIDKDGYIKRIDKISCEITLESEEKWKEYVKNKNPISSAFLYLDREENFEKIRLKLYVSIPYNETSLLIEKIIQGRSVNLDSLVLGLKMDAFKNEIDDSAEEYYMDKRFYIDISNISIHKGYYSHLNFSTKTLFKVTPDWLLGEFLKNTKNEYIPETIENNSILNMYEIIFILNKLKSSLKWIVGGFFMLFIIIMLK